MEVCLVAEFIHRFNVLLSTKQHKRLLKMAKEDADRTGSVVTAGDILRDLLNKEIMRRDQYERYQAQLKEEREQGIVREPRLVSASPSYDLNESEQAELERLFSDFLRRKRDKGELEAK
jgi:hypothetical protein